MNLPSCVPVVRWAKPAAWCWLLVTIGQLFAPADGQTSSLTPPGYIKEIPPKRTAKGPISVEVALFITDVNSINVKDMDFRVDVMFRQTWTDSRLNPEAVIDPGYNYTVLSYQLLSQLWQPDPMIVNSKKTDVAQMVDKFGSLILFRDKRITYTTKLSVLLSCQMDFKHYPYDIQTCPMYIESFGSNKEELVLAWETLECGNSSTADENYSDVDGFCRAVGITSQLKLLQFELDTDIPFSVVNVDKVYGRGKATFTRLVLSFQFTRVLTQYVVQTFVPSIFIICLAWFSFFMGMDSVPGRVTLLVTSQLTLVTMFASSLSAAIPPVSYLKAIDYWMLACLFFIFLAQIEFVVAKILDVMYRYEKTGTYYGQAGFSKPNSADAEEGHRHDYKINRPGQRPNGNDINLRTLFQQQREHGNRRGSNGHALALTKFGAIAGALPHRRNESRASKHVGSASSLGMFTKFQQMSTKKGNKQAFAGKQQQFGTFGQQQRRSQTKRTPTSEDAMTIDTDLERGFNSRANSASSSLANNPPTTARKVTPEDDETLSDDEDGLSFKLAWVDEDGDERILWLEMDVAFRIIFPVLFIIFNAIFWPLFLTRKF